MLSHLIGRAAAFILGPLLLVLLLVALSMPGRSQDAAETVVFAAASLKTALDEAVERWRAETGEEIAVSYAGSSVLARQIELGAPADIFISASTQWMDAVEEKGLIREESRRDLLGNRLVLIAGGKDAPAVEIAEGFDLAGLLAGGKLAMALVDSVPAGIYGKAALSSLGVWDEVSADVAQADNVRAALALVARGEAPYGIVYATDATAEDNVTVVGTFPESTHAPIVYPAALTVTASEPAAAFLDFLFSPEAGEIFKRQGFSLAGAER